MTSPDWDDAPPYAGPPQQQWGPPAQYGPPAYPPGQPYPPAQYGQPYGAAPPPWGAQPWGAQPWGPPPYEYPPPGWGRYAPQRPQRPGSVVAAAVIAFASTLLVLVGTVYALAFSALLSLARGPSAGIGGWVAVVQLVLAALLVVGGVRTLHGDRRWLLGAAAGQLAMSLYWVVALGDLAPSTVGGGVVVLPLLYGALAVVAGGLLFLPDVQARSARRAGTADAGG